MVLTLADVYSNEDVYSIVMFHRVHATSRYTRSSNGQQLTAAGLGIHVTDGLRFPRTKSLSAITSHPPSSVTPPPRIMGDWGQQSCRTWLAKTLRIKVCI